MFDAIDACQESQMTDPARTSLNDQAQAAQSEAERALEASAARQGVTPTTGAAAGVRSLILARLTSRATARQLAPCPHIQPARPQRQFWFAWTPDTISCGPCAKASMQPGDRMCDHCGNHVGRVVVLQLPSLVDDDQLAAVGPTTIMTVLCRQCDNVA